MDEYADPKVQIQQAIEDAQRQHQGLTQQAAQVIGNQRQLEMYQPARRYREAAGQRASGAEPGRSGHRADDAAKAIEYNNAAEAFAAQLVTAEQSVEDLKALHDQVLQAAQQAKKAVEQNAMMLQAEDRRAHQAAQPARAGQDAGAGQRLVAVDERDRRPRQHPEPR